MSSPATDGVLRARRALVADRLIGPVEIRWTHGRITAVEPTTGAADDVIVAPGFVDLQVNGIEDIDCATADAEAFATAGRHLARVGVTAWLPTLVSRPLDRYRAPLDRIAQAAAAAGPHPSGALVLGAHLEGPFLGGRPGAHRPEDLVPVDEAFLSGLGHVVRLVTLAPELDGAIPAIARLSGRGIAVSLGHSAADAVTVSEAVGAGASMVTHLFNGMGPLHHRAPGIVGVALADDRLVAGLIADLVHVDPTLVRIAFRAKGAGRIALVSDAIAWRSRQLARRAVEVVDGAPRLPDGTLAGSILTLDQAVRNVVDRAGIDVADALRSATATPARVLGDDARGQLVAGARADLVVLGADLAVHRTVVGGVVVHEA